MIISIHAPHAGRDRGPHPDHDQGVDFNPRAPCGARPDGRYQDGETYPFQSTRPMRGATYFDKLFDIDCPISIHAPHAGRDEGFPAYRRQVQISIHAPHAGRDLGSILTAQTQIISIHAPHAGRDAMPKAATFMF